MPSFSDIVAARDLITPRLRQTPVLRLDHCRGADLSNPVHLKLECLQVSGSFKIRGATHRAMTLPEGAAPGGLVAASGGNHGLATAYVAREAGLPATIFLPETASPIKAEKLRRLGAEVVQTGRFWDEAHAAATAHAEQIGAFYVHPFADPVIVAGQGTVALEMAEQIPDADTYIVAIGGGGLIAGMSTVLRELKPDARIIGVEPVGSPTLRSSLDAGHVVRLPEVTTRVATMACGRTHEDIYATVRDLVDDVVLIEDDAMQTAAELLWFEFGLAADLSAAASLAALMTGAVTLPPKAVVAGLVCGAGTDGMGA
ncbi:MAG: serine/threonine dehydratase [Maritimibacter sp.]|nr:serine/threonine dehydratase [Maritimibacter sp.]